MNNDPKDRDVERVSARDYRSLPHGIEREGCPMSLVRNAG